MGFLVAEVSEVDACCLAGDDAARESDGIDDVDCDVTALPFAMVGVGLPILLCEPVEACDSGAVAEDPEEVALLDGAEGPEELLESRSAVLGLAAAAGTDEDAGGLGVAETGLLLAVEGGLVIDDDCVEPVLTAEVGIALALSLAEPEAVVAAADRKASMLKGPWTDPARAQAGIANPEGTALGKSTTSWESQWIAQSLYSCTAPWAP